MDDTLMAQIDEQNNLLKKEIDHWTQLQVEPDQVVHINMLLVDTYLNALAAFLVEKGIIDDEEFTLYFKKKMLERLETMRKEVTPMVHAERKKALGVPTMILPNGMERKH